MELDRKPTQAMFDDESDNVKKDTQPEVVEQYEEATAEYGNIIDLPSNGVFGYPAKVTHREMMVADEEILTSSTGEQYASTLNGVLKSVLNDFKDFENMCIHDRDYALIYIWATNYDPIKRLSIECDHCEHKQNIKVDLTKIDTIPPKKDFNGAIEINLKKTGKPIKIRLNTVRDEILVEKYITEHKEAADNMTFLMNIASIDLGVETTLENKIKWVRENVNTKEMGIVKEFHRYFSFGVKTTLTHKCEKCGGETSYVLPFQVSDILRPNIHVDFDEYLRSMQSS